jgi:hypothetical protein
MTSEGSLYFGIIHIVTNYGIVIMDTGFWQKVSLTHILIICHWN